MSIQKSTISSYSGALPAYVKVISECTNSFALLVNNRIFSSGSFYSTNGKSEKNLVYTLFLIMDISYDLKQHVCMFEQNVEINPQELISTKIVGPKVGCRALDRQGVLINKNPFKVKMGCL